VALCAGVAVGTLEQVVFWNQRSAQNVDVVLFVLVLVALAVQRNPSERGRGHAGWGDVDNWRPLPALLRHHPRVRMLGPASLVLGVAATAAAPLLLERARSVTLAGMLGYAVIGVALALLTGLAGELSLGHFAIGAIAGTASVIVANHTQNFALGLLTAALVGGIVSVLVGTPAIRSRGLFLTVTTLALAVTTTSWLLPKDWMVGGGRVPPKPALGPWSIDSARGYYWFALGVGTLAFLAAAAVRRGGFGRLLIALRDAEDVASSFGVGVPLRKLQAFAVSGVLAGVGGALYAHTFAQVTVASFPATASIDVVVMVVIGGATMLAGPIIGTLFVIGVPAFLPLDAAGLATTRLGLLLLLVYMPGGFAQLLLPVRDRLVARLTAGGPAPTDPGGTGQAAAPGRHTGAVAPGRPAEVALRARGITKRYGGVHAVRAADLEVASGEIVGIIGPNGAGKTTLFEVLTGFATPDAGRVELEGVDVTGFTPARRARAGMVRTFQNSPLFPTLTVVDCIATALERAHPTRLRSSLFGRSRPERMRVERAAQLAERFGLHPYLDHRVKELSTGTRRICELACLAALAPRVVLLDEPAAGLAQREVEALVPVLRTLREELDCTMLVIEHDLPMLRALTDRMVAMVSGEVVAVGSADEVTSHPLVVAAYLGEREQAVQRSGSHPTTGQAT
jgi:ABC-type branched-subunit amino acid transport system ATPase component/ABC-type branched-subunit amino acid transport system permease subunit